MEMTELLFLSASFHLNPLYTGGLFHCYMLNEFICHFGSIGSTLSLLYFFMENPVSKQETLNKCL